MNWNDGSEDYNKIWDLKKKVARLEAELAGTLPNTDDKFCEFAKIARLNRDVVVTEKIDGTNGVIAIDITAGTDDIESHRVIRAGSRSQWISPITQDNHGFAKWVAANADDLINKLGPGRHYGEWWGSGIQRGYGLQKGEKRFSLFNTHRWSDPAVRPACCGVVPVLYTGPFDTGAIRDIIADLKTNGSKAVPGFMRPEGVVIYHTAANLYFKVTCEKDDKPKGQTGS